MKPLYFIFILALTLASASENPLETLFYNGNNRFTAEMLKEVANANPDRSFVLSAYSVLNPLAQLGFASVDDARKELLDTIGMPDANVAKEVFALLNNKLEDVKGVTLKTASKIYIAEGYELNNEFAVVSRQTFKSDVDELNFLNNQEAANKVNSWVEAQTNNRIKDLVDPSSLTSDTRALLVNAIYFKGTWETKFDTARTVESSFYKNSNVQNKVSMMFNKGDYKYVESEKLKSQIIEIPYKGNQASLIVVLPREVEGISEVKEILKDPNVLENALNTLSVQEVKLSLPKFKIETTTNLKEVLIKLNVTKAFSPLTAKLYNLIQDAGKNLYIGHATQKAFIEVNEEGAEAAAGNEFGIFTYSLVISPTYDFVADHPFIFYLRVKGTTVFSGAFYN